MVIMPHLREQSRPERRTYSHVIRLTFFFRYYKLHYYTDTPNAILYCLLVNNCYSLPDYWKFLESKIKYTRIGWVLYSGIIIIHIINYCLRCMHLYNTLCNDYARMLLLCTIGTCEYNYYHKKKFSYKTPDLIRRVVYHKKSFKVYGFKRTLRE